MKLELINFIHKAISNGMNECPSDEMKVEKTLIETALEMADNVWEKIEAEHDSEPGMNLYTPSEFTIFNLQLMLNNILKTEIDGLCLINVCDWYQEINQLKQMLNFVPVKV